MNYSTLSLQKNNAYRRANLLFFLTILYLTLVSAFNIGGRLGKLIGNNDYLFKIGFSQFEFLLPLLIFLYINSKKYDISAAKTLNFKLLSPLKLALSVICAAAILPFLYLINSISLIWVKDVTTPEVEAAAAKHPMWLMVLFVAVIPAFIEEMTYRGVYFNTYRRKRIMFGALLQALIFGLMHGNLNQFAYAFIAGFIFAMFDFAADSVLFSFVMHALINGSSVVNMYYHGNRFFKWAVVSEKTLPSVLKTFLLPALLGIVILAGCYLILRHISVKKAEEKPETIKDNLKDTENDAKVFDEVLIVAIIIMMVNMIVAELG